jgi:hypothetical protein
MGRNADESPSGTARIAVVPDGRVTLLGELEARIGGLEAELTERLPKVVIPVLIAANLLIVAVATWIGTVVG